MIREEINKRQSGCIFCEIPEERIIEFNALAFAIRDKYSATELYKELLKLIDKHAHFRYPVDGPSEIEKILQKVIDEVFGPTPNSAYNRWVRKLQENGLIP